MHFVLSAECCINICRC